jgi:hypothetical protein
MNLAYARSMRASQGIVVCLLLCTACSKKADAPAAGGDAASAAPVKKESELDQLARKENAYVTCLNSFSGDVWQGRGTWLDEFDEKKGPQAKQAGNGPWYGPLKLADVKDCKSGVEAAGKMPPSIPALEAAGAAYVAAVEQLAPLCAAMRDYFDQGDYKDDKMQKAIDAHPKLLAAWDAFGKADSDLGTQIDQLEDKIQGEQLAQIEQQEGKKIHYLHVKLLIDAKKVVRFAGDIATPAEVPLEPYTAAVQALEQSTTDVTTYYDAHKDEVEQDIPSYWTFENPAKDFLKDAKDLMRRARDKDKFSSGEKMTIEADNAEAVEGHPRRVVHSYNALIDASNQLQM